MKIGLIYPNEGKKEKAIHLGLGYIVAYARQIHPDVEFEYLDTRIATSKEKSMFLKKKFDLVGITLMSGIFKQALCIAQEIKRNNPDFPICVGGPYVSSLDEEILDFKEFDLAVMGEGEITFSEIIDHLKGNKELTCINGLIYRDKAGKTIVNTSRGIGKNINELPMPAYDIFRMNEYPNFRMVTSRGCPYRCSFCSSADVWEYKWQKRSPEKIVEEIKYLLHTYGRKTFFFNDDTFNMSQKRAEDICDLLIKEDLKILWSTPFRADRVDETLAVKMKKSGCYNVGIGIESADNEILQLLDKQITIEQITNGIKILRSAGIEVLGQFIIGLPGETDETFIKTLEYAKKSELDFVLFYSSVPYKKTAQWKYIEENGRLLHTTMHEFPDIKPRIIFETKAFTYAQRAAAIKTAESAGFYVDDNRMSHIFDFGRNAAKYFQQVLPAKAGNVVYLAMKKIYRNHLKDKWIKV
jgi:anaerobic magnesium-protoporphyrin IX monomethyl ester cyclase